MRGVGQQRLVRLHQRLHLCGGIVEATVYGSSAKANALCALYNGEATLTTDEPDFWAYRDGEEWVSRPKGTWGARPAWLGIEK